MGKQPQTETKYYQRPDGSSFGVLVPKGYDPTPADLDRAANALTAQRQAAPSPSSSASAAVTSSGRPDP